MEQKTAARPARHTLSSVVWIGMVRTYQDRTFVLLTSDPWYR